MQNRIKQKAFTLVEVVMIVSVLAILGAITTVGYGAWQQNIAKSQAKSDLQILASALNSQKNFESDTTFPPTTFKASSDIVVSRSWIDSNSSSRYCIQAYNVKFPTQSLFYIDTTQSTAPKQGSCPSAPFPPSAPTPSAVANSGAQITVSWPNVSNATGYSVKYGIGSPSISASCTSSPCVITGLSAGSTYIISVVATNSYGSSAAGTATVTTTAPAVPAPAASGVTYTTSRVKVGGTYYQRYVVTTSGGSCSVGSTEWKIGVTGGATPSWTSVNWQSSNTRTIDVPENGSYSATDVTIFTRASCVSGSDRTEGNPAYAYNGNGGGASTGGAI